MQNIQGCHFSVVFDGFLFKQIYNALIFTGEAGIREPGAVERGATGEAGDGVAGAPGVIIAGATGDEANEGGAAEIIIAGAPGVRIAGAIVDGATED
jgi:hypothetical protein